MSTRIKGLLIVLFLSLLIFCSFFQDFEHDRSLANAEQMMKEADYLGALVHLNYLHRKSSDLEIVLKRAECMIALKKYEQASESIESLIVKNIPEAIYLQAIIYSAKSDTVLANKSYMRAIQLQGNDSLQSLYTLKAVEMNLHARNFQLSDSLLNAVPLKLFQAQAYYYRGVSLRYLADYFDLTAQDSILSRAEIMLNKALAYDSTYADAWFQLSMIYAARMNAAKAEFNIEKAVEREPDNLYYQLMKANILRNTGQCETAQKLYNEILNIHPRYDLAFEERAILYLQCFQDTVKANNDLQKLQLLRSRK
jgi:Tfp pilus assembly protein PilF